MYLVYEALSFEYLCGGVRRCKATVIPDTRSLRPHMYLVYEAFASLQDHGDSPTI
jgi:hypothetical protein